MRVIVCGGSGFVGNHLISLFLRERPHWNIVNLDLVPPAMDQLPLKKAMDKGQYQWIQGDIGDEALLKEIMGRRVGAVINLAAVKTNDEQQRGLLIKTNVLGTQTILEAALTYGVGRLLQVSDGEVYGVGEGPGFSERSSLNPLNPYGASKGAADLLVAAYHRAYQLNTGIIRPVNVYGPGHPPNSPLGKIIEEEFNGSTNPQGEELLEEWLFVGDLCIGILKVLEYGRPGRIYNMGGSGGYTLEELRWIIQKRLGKKLLTPQIEALKRLAYRYGPIRDCRIRKELNWMPMYGIEEGLGITLDWYGHQRKL